MPLLINNIELLRNAFKHTKTKFDFEIFASVILPDHMHLMLKPDKIKEYPKIIGMIKHNFSRHIDTCRVGNCPPQELNPPALSQSKLKKREKGIWQRRYYEHTILNEDDFAKHLDYIHFNPVKHELVNNVQDWEYSSFHKFVKMNYYEQNWGSLDDVKAIKEMNLE